MSTSTFEKSTRGFSYLFSLSIMTKLFTFLANALVISALDPEKKGVIFNLELLLNSSLLLTREAFRRACLRQNQQQQQQQQQTNRIRNVAWCVVPFGFVVTLLLSAIYRNFTLRANSEYEAIPHMLPAISLYFIAVMIELIVEPLFIRAQNEMNFSIRVKTEGFAILAKVLISLLLVKTLASQWVLIAVGVAQCAYSLVIVVGYLYEFVIRQRNSLRELLPQPLNSNTANKTWLDRDLLSLVLSFEWQSLLKYVLTYGENLVLISFRTLGDQGAYDVVANLGSLVVRLVFQPIEENSFSTFSRVLNQQQRSEEFSTDVIRCRKMLLILLKLVVLIGCIFAFFGPAYSKALLFVMYGQKWANHSEAPRVLAYYSFYVLLLGVNGITEAFVHAVSDTRQIRLFNYWMVGFSAVYLSSAWLLMEVLHFGTAGLVLANCVNMAMRIIFSVVFIRSYFTSVGKRNDDEKLRNLDIEFRTALPSPIVLVAFVVSGGVALLSEHLLLPPSLPVLSWLAALKHIVVGAILFVVTLATTYLKEKSYLHQMRSLVSGKPIII